jgi:hypothetical protein
VSNRHRLDQPRALWTSKGRREPSSSTASALAIASMPAAFAALWKRGVPYTPPRSATATAGNPSVAARSASASGSLAPSRNENAVCACSSQYRGSGFGHRAPVRPRAAARAAPTLELSNFMV